MSDPNPASEEVTVFKLSFDGGAAIDSVPVSNAVRHDLAGITSGSHTVTAQACNLWGCSVVSSPFCIQQDYPKCRWWDAYCALVTWWKKMRCR